MKELRVPASFKVKRLEDIKHNQRIKEYPQGILEVLTCSRPIFREPGYEPEGFWSEQPRSGCAKTDERSEESPRPEVQITSGAQFGAQKQI